MSISCSMPMARQVAPEQARQIGRSRVYTAADLPARLRHWHTPRVNRRESLGVGALTGMLSNSRTLFWHPLDAASTSFTALIARSSRPYGLADYLGRDHAVIEAAPVAANARPVSGITPPSSLWRMLTWRRFPRLRALRSTAFPIPCRRAGTVRVRRRP